MVLKVWSWEPWAVPETLSGELLSWNNFHNKIKTLLSFFTLILSWVQSSFLETTWHGMTSSDSLYSDVFLNCNLVHPLWKTVWRILKKLKIELPYDPVIPLLRIYPKEIKTLTRKISVPHFIVVLFTVARQWKQSKHPSMDEWVKKLWCVYIYIYHIIYINGILFSQKNEEILSFLRT